MVSYMIDYVNWFDFIHYYARLQNKDTSAQLEETFQSMRSTLDSSVRSDGTFRPSTSSQQVAAINKQCLPVQGSTSNLHWVNKTKGIDYIIGDQV